MRIEADDLSCSTRKARQSETDGCSTHVADHVQSRKKRVLRDHPSVRGCSHDSIWNGTSVHTSMEHRTHVSMTVVVSQLPKEGSIRGSALFCRDALYHSDGRLEVKKRSSLAMAS